MEDSKETKREKKAKTEYKGNHDSQSGLYQALMNHYLHQDRLLWSRVQFFTAVQGAVLAGAFIYKPPCSWLSAGIMFIGAVITGAILYLVWLDISDRDRNLNVMDKLAEDLLPNKIKNKFQCEGVKQPFIRLCSESPSIRRYIGGGRSFRILLIAFIVLDLILGILLGKQIIIVS